ncbi:DNA polymerase III subunit alpha [Nevskia ramosa]|uniref:DNA polymerase III subunit alpha n=1 Tax=Nevskia ramosa TaxID=64002 RepID=UPI00235400AC|nr:DNA polymerase III subunit alpha [Nevskia ramosa]
MFVHLHLHTEFSLVDSLIRVEAPARKSAGANVQTLTGFAAKLGLPAIAVTDQDNLFAMVKFYKLAEAAGVKPIIGADIAMPESGVGEQAENVTLLVQNDAGYRNLTRLLSRAYNEGQGRGRPRIHRAWIEAASDGLIALSGRDGEIGRALVAGKVEHARGLTQWWSRFFPDRLYLEITRCGRRDDDSHLRAAVSFARDTGLPVVASNEVRFLERGDFDAHEARVCINQGRVINDDRRPREYTPDQYLKSAEEMIELFADLPEAVENTLEIARRCTLSLSFGVNHLPDYPVPEGFTVPGYLRKTAQDGLEQRFAHQGAFKPVEEYQQRLDFELAVIERMGFVGYFLVVADFIRWGKSNGVPVGPGRGSGAGSLVAYAIGITDLDPLPYNLLFERFLNPERVSLPDFDVDFCIEGRDRVIAYVAEKYGRERVSQIITYGSMAARAVVRDVTRVMGHPYGLGDRIAKLIPGAPAFKADAEKAGRSSLEHALVEVPDLKAAYDAEEDLREIIDLGMALEDLTRGVGIHAGGVVIAPLPLTEYTPMFCEAGGAGLRTQFDMKDCETVGLVKFDFLGLRTLTIIESAVQQINARWPDKKLDILSLPLTDREAYKLYAEGQTTAVFQMESQGMQRASVDLKPDCFEDIIALISLYRPGPMDLIPQYCRRKHGTEEVTYLHPDMEGVLKPTYGNFVYQEQVMQMAQVLAGYTLGGADMLRRAMGKKKPEEMAQQRGIFEKGAAERGIDAPTASAVFSLMEKFAGYGFNKSHAAAYALVSYQTAWLKAHYPAQFMAAVMSAEMSHTDTVVVMLEECRRMKQTVLPPDVNSSEYRFTVNAAGAIVYGLGAVKGAGEGAIDGIINERRSHGAFLDLFDFCRRIDTRKANRRVLEALIGAGAMDCFQLNRPSLMKTLPKALQLAEQTAASAGAGIADLFGLGAPADASNTGTVAAELETDWEPNERLSVEKKVLGLYLSGHPVEAYRTLIEQVCSGTIKTLIDEAGPPPDFGGNTGGGGDDEEGAPAPRRRGYRKQVMLAGWLTDIRTIMGDRPGKILILDDRTAQLVCWLDFQDWQRFQTLLKPDTLIFATGSISASQREGRELEYRLSAKSFYDLDSLLRERTERVTLTWKKPSIAVTALPQRLAPWRGPNGAAVSVEYWNGTARAVLDWGTAWRLKFETAAETELKRLLGAESVKAEYRRWVAPVSSNQRSRAEYDDGE